MLTVRVCAAKGTLSPSARGTEARELLRGASAGHVPGNDTQGDGAA
jgi:hypothetical protein